MLILVNLGAKSAMMDKLSNKGKDNRMLKNQRILFYLCESCLLLQSEACFAVFGRSCLLL